MQEEIPVAPATEGADDPYAWLRDTQLPAVRAYLAAERQYYEHRVAPLRGLRDELRQHLRGRGIGTEIYYPVPLNRQKCFAFLEGGSFPESEAAAQQVLALPIFPELTDSEIELVAGAVTSFFKK